MSELQLGLLAIGVGFVASVFLYNKWQERQYRRKAEMGFAQRHEDVLMRGASTRDRHPADPSERVEPMLGSIDSASSDANALIPTLTERVDYIVPIEASEEIYGSEVLRVVAGVLNRASKPVRWEGYDRERQAWQTLRPDQAYLRLRAGLQLVDRRGAASEDEIADFGLAVQEAATAFGAQATVPEIAPAAAAAEELDRFCSEVDIRVAVHVVGYAGKFSGSQVRAFAETAGLELDAKQGKFCHLGRTGRILCTLGNMEEVPFSSQGIDSLKTGGVTMEFDVPKASSGDFDRFRYLAEGLAGTLSARIVDDNRQPLGPVSLDAIGSQVRRVHQSMEARGIQPAGALALRLFS